MTTPEQMREVMDRALDRLLERKTGRTLVELRQLVAQTVLTEMRERDNLATSDGER